jgi:hypothetical protein
VAVRPPHGVTPFVEVHATAVEMLAAAGVIGERSNRGPVQLPDTGLVRPTVERAEDTLRFQFQAAAAPPRRGSVLFDRAWRHSRQRECQPVPSGVLARAGLVAREDQRG